MKQTLDAINISYFLIRLSAVYYYAFKKRKRTNRSCNCVYAYTYYNVRIRFYNAMESVIFSLFSKCDVRVDVFTSNIRWRDIYKYSDLE